MREHYKPAILITIYLYLYHIKLYTQITKALICDIKM